MLTWTEEYSQESEDDMIETAARKRAEYEYAKWQDRQRMIKARKFHFGGGQC